MKTVVGTYNSHQAAVDALADLKKAGFPVSRISLMSKADFVDGQVNLKSIDFAEKAELGFGMGAGSILGLLTGVGVFAIPGLGLLYGAGAVVGVLAGMELGGLGSSVAVILTQLGIDKLNSIKYERALREGKYLVIAGGNKTDAKQAAAILGNPEAETN